MKDFIEKYFFLHYSIYKNISNLLNLLLFIGVCVPELPRKIVVHWIDLGWSNTQLISHFLKI